MYFTTFVLDLADHQGVDLKYILGRMTPQARLYCMTHKAEFYTLALLTLIIVTIFWPIALFILSNIINGDLRNL